MGEPLNWVEEKNKRRVAQLCKTAILVFFQACAVHIVTIELEAMQAMNIICTDVQEFALPSSIVFEHDIVDLCLHAEMVTWSHQ